MCRFVAYHGPPMELDELLYRPDHSIIDQSMHAEERAASRSTATAGASGGTTASAPRSRRSTSGCVPPGTTTTCDT